jgi:hypothetical protein
MRGKKSKLIRKLMGFNINKNDNPILCRNYRRVKKTYTQCPEDKKALVLVAIGQKFSNNNK